MNRSKNPTPRLGSADDNCHGGSIMMTSNNLPVNFCCSFPNDYFVKEVDVHRTNQLNDRTSALIGRELAGISQSRRASDMSIPIH